MPTIAAQRAAFASASKTTATPQALLVMLYDRLVLDLQRAEAAMGTKDLGGVNQHLNHAQDIVTELAGALDPKAWDGGPALASLYTWLLAELVAANVAKDATRIAAARELVAPLAQAWRQASNGETATGEATAAGGTTGRRSSALLGSTA